MLESNPFLRFYAKINKRKIKAKQTTNNYHNNIISRIILYAYEEELKAVLYLPLSSSVDYLSISSK